MIHKQFSVRKRTSLRKKALPVWSFIHGSMYGSYQTECKIVERHADGMVTIEYYDFITKDMERTKRNISALSFN